jgi:hypothetical protein
LKLREYGFAANSAIHQISYSGLGTKSGGPLGGRDQNQIIKLIADGLLINILQEN